MQINPQEAKRIYQLKLIDSVDKPTGLKLLGSWALSKVFNSLFGVIKPDFKQELPEDLRFNPYVDSQKYGCMHYGIMIPDLPAPHHFMACASIIGNAGMRVFDIDFASEQAGPRQMATISHGTAVTKGNGFYNYVLNKDIQTKEDGSLLKFGDDICITGIYPNYRLQSQTNELKVDLKLTASGQITWFAKSAVYNHLSLLTRYEGTIDSEGVQQQVSGLCTYEYARGVSPHNVVNKPIPFSKKIPWDFFTYQVIDLDEDTQLCLTHCRGLNYPILTAAYIRTTQGVSRGIEGSVRFQVLSVEDELVVDPDGIHMLRPKTFRWTIEDKHQEYSLTIEATVDTNWLYGLGRGYIAGYEWHGTKNGKATTGRGYVEYVDVRY